MTVFDRNLAIKTDQDAENAGWQLHGERWELVSKAYCHSTKSMRSTKRLRVDGGYLYQVSTIENGHVAEALAFVPDQREIKLSLDVDGDD